MLATADKKYLSYWWNETPVWINGLSICGTMRPLCRRNEMAGHGFNRVIGALIAGSMMFGSTAAVASTSLAPQQVNPWAVLTAMSGGAPAAAVCGAAAAAAAAQ